MPMRNPGLTVGRNPPGRRSLSTPGLKVSPAERGFDYPAVGHEAARCGHDTLAEQGLAALFGWRAMRAQAVEVVPTGGAESEPGIGVGATVAMGCGVVEVHEETDAFVLPNHVHEHRSIRRFAVSHVAADLTNEHKKVPLIPGVLDSTAEVSRAER